MDYFAECPKDYEPTIIDHINIVKTLADEIYSILKPSDAMRKLNINRAFEILNSNELTNNEILDLMQITFKKQSELINKSFPTYIEENNGEKENER
jgi:hypothetical protein